MGPIHHKGPRKEKQKVTVRVEGVMIGWRLEYTATMSRGMQEREWIVPSELPEVHPSQYHDPKPVDLFWTLASKTVS